MAASDRITCDYLIIGSGLAGLSAALKASRHGSVLVVTKSEAAECNTRYAQGGIACVIAEGDSFEAHVLDTLAAGAGLCREDVVRAIVAAGPERVQELQEWGVHFTRRGEVEGDLRKDEAQDYDLGREGGHSQRRVLHAGDITGQELVRALLEQCRANPR
ncbi:MAG: FAD-dependent oxidoreductase, partial [Lentisphaeria bacterium]|nr:FAD-dependent oxidoreductase [Lentisphaeria bacterium]